MRRFRLVAPGVGLLFAVAIWSCGDDGGTGPGGEGGAGSLSVRLTLPTGVADAGILLEVSGPRIDSVSTIGYQLYESGSANQRRILLAGLVRLGEALEIHVPDVEDVGLYSARVLQVAGTDFTLREPGDYGVEVVR